MGALSDSDRGKLRTIGIAVLIAVSGGAAIGVYDHITGTVTPSTDSTLLVTGLVAIGFGVYSLAGGFGDIGRANRVVMLINLAIGVIAFAMSDVPAIMHHGLRVTTPFVVAITMAMLGVLRRR